MLNKSSSMGSRALVDNSTVSVNSEQKLILVNARLKVVQGEVLDETKKSDALQKRSAVLDIEIQDKQKRSAALDSEISSKAQKSEDLDTQLERMNREIAALKVEEDRINAAQQVRENNLTVRVQQQDERERSHAAEAQSLASEKDELARTREQIVTAYEAFKKAAALTETWK